MSAFGTFVDRSNGAGPVRIFSRGVVASPVCFRAGLTFAPGAVKSWSFWKRGQWNHLFVARRLDLQTIPFSIERGRPIVR